MYGQPSLAEAACDCYLTVRTRSSLEVDHVIAGTGFHVDIARLAYLSEELRARIATFSGYPVLTRPGESTVPGLYFVGAPAAFGLGPSMRFIAGTHNVAAQVARSVVRRAKGSKGWPLASGKRMAASLWESSSAAVER